MLEKIFLFKFREMVYREVCDFFYEILFDIRYFMVQLNVDLNIIRYIILKVFYIMILYNCINSIDNQKVVIK